LTLKAMLSLRFISFRMANIQKVKKGIKTIAATQEKEQEYRFS
jgi:hypothetical protein